MAKMNLLAALQAALEATKAYVDDNHYNQSEVDKLLSYKQDAESALKLGETSSTAYRGDRGKIAYDHSQVAHAPSNAQKNSDITKAEIEAKLTGAITTHSHSYAGSSTAGGAATSANKVNQSLKVQLNGGTTEGTDLFTFNGSAAKTINLTPDSLGLSAAGHNHDDRYYTETEINTKLGEVEDNIGKAVEGMEGLVNGEAETRAAEDTKLQKAIDSEATTRLNADNALDARLDVLEGSGTGSVAKALADAKSYADTKVAGILDSAPETLNTLNELATALGNDANFATTISTQIGGKAPTSHASSATTYGASSASNYGHAKASSTTPKANGTAAAGSETSSFARGDHVHPLQTSVSGNAGSADKVNNALSIQLNGGTATSFDGSATKSINITPASIGAAAAHNHDAYVNQNAFSKIAIGNTNIVADVAEDTLTLIAGSNVTITPDATNDKITIAATDTIYTHPSYTAKVSGLYKITVDGTGHVSSVSDVAKSDITALGIPAQDTVYTHPTEGANTGSFGNSSNQTPAYGATFNVPYITVNNKGHVTAISNKTVKIPASDNTWRGVQDNLTSTATDQSLSANQGKVLKGLVDGKADMIEESDLTAMLTTVFGN